MKSAIYWWFESLNCHKREQEHVSFRSSAIISDRQISDIVRMFRKTKRHFSEGDFLFKLLKTIVRNKSGWKMETVIAPCLWPEADYWGWVIIFIIGPGPPAWPGPGNGLSWDKKTRKQMPPSKPLDTALLPKLFYKQTLGPSEDEARGDNFPGGRGKHC